MNASSDRVEQSGILTSIYRAIIVALAITVVGIYFIRTPLIALVGQSEIMLESAKAVPDSSQFDATHQIRSLDQFIDDAVAKTLQDSSLIPILESSPELSISLDLPSDLIQEKELELLRHRIQIKHEHPEANQIAIQVEFEANNTPVVLDISDQVAARFAQEIQSATETAANQVKQAAAEKTKHTRLIVKNARQRLAAFEEQHRETLGISSSENNTEISDHESKEVESPLLEKIKTAKWTELSTLLKAAEKELGDATSTQTAAHPSVVNLQAKVVQLKSQLAQTPEYKGEDTSALAVIESGNENQADPSQNELQKQKKEVLAQQLKLQNDLVKSEQQESELDGYRAFATELQIYYQSILVSSPTDAKISSSIGGLFPWYRLCLLMLGAIICGGIVTYIYPKPKTDVIHSLEALSNAISTPLVGTIPSTQHAPTVLRPTPWRDSGSQWTTRISEYVLVSIALLLLFSVIFVPNFTQTFIDTPFMALFDAQHTLWSLLG
ncbi:MAG: hypothetical protein COA78_04275 [Blastopirellula sp.]|nr:MAG: hypothetical protein COA78_04275 [Blastopirellula sp.]